MASPAPSIPDTQLGLSPDEIQLLRRHQPLALSLHHHPHGRGASPASSTRTTSTSQPHALLLDPRSLAALSYHFDRLLLAIQERVNYLNEQTMRSVDTSNRRAMSAMDAADAEIRRFREIIRQIEELEGEFEKVRRVGEIVKGWRGRVEGLEGRLGR